MEEIKESIHPISGNRIVELVRDNAESIGYKLGDTIEVVVSAKLEELSNFSDIAVSCIVNDKVYFIYNDFYSFKGKPNTRQAKKYINSFEKFYAEILHGPVFSIYYRNIKIKN